LFAGLFLGVLLGGWGVFFALDRFNLTQSQTVESRRAIEVCPDVVGERSVTHSGGTSIFDELEKEISHGR
jgi:hypothetical protein